MERPRVFGASASDAAIEVVPCGTLCRGHEEGNAAVIDMAGSIDSCRRAVVLSLGSCGLALGVERGAKGDLWWA
jgi:hypothetical protein